MNKAQSIVQALGGRVSRVLEENESATVAGERMMEYHADASYAGYPPAKQTPITSGQLSIKSNVQLIVEIES